MKKAIFELVVIFVVFILLMNVFNNNRDKNANNFLSQPWFYSLVAAAAAVVVDKILDKWFKSEKYMGSQLAQYLER